MEIKQFDTVRLKDGAEGTAVEIYPDGSIYMDVGTTSETWDSYYVPIDDIAEVIPQSA
ncbi:hypothetical protein FACS1894202_09860 [Clostridia bacterium]|nr:hypothetical protein FACS1894202_09860 [Clostridia bacterium]